MLRIGICDDDLLEVQKIEEYISHMPFHDLETGLKPPLPDTGQRYFIL